MPTLKIHVLFMFNQILRTAKTYTQRKLKNTLLNAYIYVRSKPMTADEFWNNNLFYFHCADIRNENFVWSNFTEVNVLR